MFLFVTVISSQWIEIFDSTCDRRPWIDTGTYDAGHGLERKPVDSELLKEEKKLLFGLNLVCV